LMGTRLTSLTLPPAPEDKYSVIIFYYYNR